MDGGLPPPAPPLERSDVVTRGYLLSGKARRLSPGVITDSAVQCQLQHLCRVSQSTSCELMKPHIVHHMCPQHKMWKELAPHSCSRERMPPHTHRQEKGPSTDLSVILATQTSQQELVCSQLKEGSRFKHKSNPEVKGTTGINDANVKRKSCLSAS